MVLIEFRLGLYRSLSDLWESRLQQSYRYSIPAGPDSINFRLVIRFLIGPCRLQKSSVLRKCWGYFCCLNQEGMILRSVPRIIGVWLHGFFIHQIRPANSMVRLWKKKFWISILKKFKQMIFRQDFLNSLNLQMVIFIFFR